MFLTHPDVGTEGEGRRAGMRVARKDCMEGQARILFYVFGGRVYLFYAVCSLTIVAIVLFLSFFFLNNLFL